MNIEILYPWTVIQAWEDIIKQLLDSYEFYEENKSDLSDEKKKDILELLEWLFEIKKYLITYWNMNDEAKKIIEVENKINNFLINNK